MMTVEGAPLSDNVKAEKKRLVDMALANAKANGGKFEDPDFPKVIYLYLSVYLSFFLFVYLDFPKVIHLSISIYLSIYLSFFLSVSIYSSISLSIYLSMFDPCIHLLIDRSIYICIYVYI